MIETEVKHNISKICCIGAGYVGGPTMAVLADNCKNIVITVVDTNQERINNWNSENYDDIPVFEPGLAEIIKRRRNINLFFSTNISKEIASADMIFVSVNTPTKKKGIGAGQASDLKWIEICSRDISKYAKGHTIVVEKSTVPVKTAQVIKSILNSKKNKNTFSVLSNPEFLAEGTAVNDLKNPDRILIGGEDQNAITSLRNIYLNWVGREKIIETNIWSSELSKLTANAFLAQRLSSINSISALCEKTGASTNEVSKAIGADTRIGNKFLNTGPGFGGSCFKKDILNLIYLSNYFELREVASYWQSVIEINEWQKDRICQIIVDKLFGTISGKNITILGFSFKANTNDTRESPAIDISKNLLEEGAKLKIYDPKVNKSQIENDLNLKEKDLFKNNEGSWEFNTSIEEALIDSDAAIFLTEWQEFCNLDWEKLSQIMRRPAWVFDTRSIVKSDDILKTDLKLWKMGEGAVNYKSIT
tara:strand:+ start:2896 stop:4323 length:1428 start_codon:yes stop_codon:yes gene_type:complete